VPRTCRYGKAEPALINSYKTVPKRQINVNGKRFAGHRGCFCT
jgi:hypothetical protein